MPAHSWDRDSLVSRLRAAGCVFAEEEACLLLAEASDPAGLERMVAQRIDGLPLEQILGWVRFCGLRIALEPEVFVPRRRTEFLAARAIDLAVGRPHPVVLDLCCGSGAIAVVIASRLDPVELYAADVQSAAVTCARRNLGNRGRVVEGDLFTAVPIELRGRFDVIVANAPYVPTGKLPTLPQEARLYEPVLTLDGGDGGLGLHRRIAVAAPEWLAPGGHLLVECSEDQAPQLMELFTAAGLSATVDGCDEPDSTIVIGTVPHPRRNGTSVVDQR